MTGALHGQALAQALMAPRSIALLGASDDPGKTAGRPLPYLRSSGYGGVLYAINPHRTQVQGERAYPSIAALPDVPAQAFVLTPTEGVVAAVQQCVDAGVPLVTVLAAGFSETGPEGVAREAALRDVVHGSGTRLLGPSSLGIVNPRNGLVLTANAAFAEPGLPTGKVFVASHSGSMIGALVSRGKARGVGFAGLISVGGEADLSLGEICSAVLDDAEIGGYLLFLESLRHGAALRAFARAAALRGKPVVAYKLGQSAAAAELSATHTGALAGEDDVADAFLKDLGVARVGTFEALLETLPLALKMPLRRGAPQPRRVGVVTTTGGGAAMAVDQLGIRGVTVALPSEATLARLRDTGLPSQPARVLDLTLAGTRYDVMKAAIATYLAAPEFDLVLAVVGSSARLKPELAVKPIIDSAGHAKPLAAFLVPEAPEAIAALTAAGVPCFRTPEACGDAIAAVFARRLPAEAEVPAQRGHGDGEPAFIDEAEAYALLDTLAVPRAPSLTVPLDAAALPALPTLPFPYPLAVKLCSAALPHKTDVGGVVLNVADEPALRTALTTLRDNAAKHAPGIAAGRALIQPMCAGLGEVLIGYRVDPGAGPIVMLAAGGIWAELQRDRSLRLAPVSVEAAHEMIGEVRALQALQGLRGKPRGDLQALAEAISALSQLALRPELGVNEAEINPLIVGGEGQGVVAVDALVRVMSSSR